MPTLSHIFTVDGFFDYFSLSSSWHNETGPANIDYDEDTGNITELRWSINNNIHRKDKPALLCFYLNGNIFCKEFYIQDYLHREDGPAVIEYDESNKYFRTSYYLNHELIGETYEDYKKFIFKNKEEYAYMYNKILKEESIHMFD